MHARSSDGGQLIKIPGEAIHGRITDSSSGMLAAYISVALSTTMAGRILSMLDIRPLTKMNSIPLRQSG